MKWVIWTPEETAAYEALPETIEWRKQEERAARNARAHCGSCGRFVRASTLTYRNQDDLWSTCSRCGDVAVA